MIIPIILMVNLTIVILYTYYKIIQRLHELKFELHNHITHELYTLKRNELYSVARDVAKLSLSKKKEMGKRRNRK